MSEAINFDRAMEIYKEWVSYFRAEGDPSGCARNNEYSIPLKSPSDVQEGESVSCKTLGLVALDSSNPDNPCNDSQVLLYLKTSSGETYQCWEDIKPFCTTSNLEAPLPSSSNNFGLFNDKYLNKLADRFTSSLAEAKQNPLFGSSAVFSNGLTLALTACILGICGGLKAPSDEQRVAQAPQTGVAVLASSG